MKGDDKMNKIRQIFVEHYSLIFVSVAAGAALISLYLDFRYFRIDLFQRSGSIMAFCGALLYFRHETRRGIAGALEDNSVIDGGDLSNPPEQVESQRQAGHDHKAKYIGAIIAAIGTLIWGYGDFAVEWMKTLCVRILH